MKLNLICGKDELRPVMSYVKVTRENMVATNAHVLGVIPTKNLFNEEFIEEIPEEGFLILGGDYAKIIDGSSHHWKNEFLAYFDKKSNLCFVPVANESDIAKYPNWEQIMPTTAALTANLNQIGIDFELAATLQKALGLKYGCKLTFSGGFKAIYIEPINTHENEGAYGILMPKKID